MESMLEILSDYKLAVRTDLGSLVRSVRIYHIEVDASQVHHDTIMCVTDKCNTDMSHRTCMCDMDRCVRQIRVIRIHHTQVDSIQVTPCVTV